MPSYLLASKRYAPCHEDRFRHRYDPRFPLLFRFFAWRLSNACNAQTCITRNTPIASPPSDVRYLTSSTGNRIAVWCDHVTGNLVYEDTYNGNLDVVKDGCLAS